MRIRILAAATAAALTTGGAQAASFGIYDARSVGMANIGTSAGNPSNASFYNPALLGAAHEDADFSAEFFQFSGRLAAQEDAQDTYDTFFDLSDGIDETSNNLEDFNQSRNPDSARLAAENIQGVSSDLSFISDSTPLELDLFAPGFGAASPSRGIGWAFHITGSANIGTALEYSSGDENYVIASSDGLANAADFYETYENGGYDDDIQQIEGGNTDVALIDDLGNLASNDAVNVQGFDDDGNVDVTSFDPNDPSISVDDREEFDGDGDGASDGDWTSRVSVRGLAIGEFGISLSRNFNILGQDVAFGLTPKYMQVETIDTTFAADEDIEIEEDRTSEDAFNADFGMASMWDNGIRVGFIAKNLASQEFTSARGNTLSLDPQFRAGVSHHTDISTIGIDIDLTENDPVAEGFGRSSQYAGIGGEFDAWNWLQLRAGYRTDLADSYEDTLHAGVGLFHIVDVGAAYSEQEVQASVRLGMRF